MLAGYARYLKGIDDNGQAFEPSTDPLLAELQAIVAPLEVKEGEQDFSCLKSCTAVLTCSAWICMPLVWARRSRQWPRSCSQAPALSALTLHKYVKAR